MEATSDSLCDIIEKSKDKRKILNDLHKTGSESRDSSSRRQVMYANLYIWVKVNICLPRRRYLGKKK